MGSPRFALPTLEALLEAGHEPALVVTLPDREAGRGQHPTPSAVARAARERGLPLYQTGTLKTAASREPLEAARPDVIVVASFGLLLPAAVLDLPPHGCLNVHPSLLPRHRGASPIPAALLAGDGETGVTIMLMDPGLDSGPILAQRALPIAPDDDALSLEASLAALGARLLVDNLPGWVSGAIIPRPQEAALVTYAPKIRREDAWLDWTLPAELLLRRVRAYRAWPTAYTTLGGALLKVLRARVAPLTGAPAEPGRVGFPFRSGRRSGPPAVQTAAGLLVLEEVQPAGRSPMSGEEFARGQRALDGALLGGGS